jgi:Tfp pilus assembly protein PilN
MITLEADNKITLRGQAQSMSDVFKFITTLDNSGYFKDIQTKYTTKKRIADTDISEFEIVCPMAIGKK